ncbi:protein of unknown function [Bartonella clarridgeiae 73]|uniref:Uncharacterized protein n=1 Tax=Bartonella clarridgeiae (strain CCUG 45776 / CIP 104772 / 73) TaxID=696125 RepID=E6YI84_BARC7|nr:protein of unknown function [Bartonella clarridgeiae 73]
MSLVLLNLSFDLVLFSFKLNFLLHQLSITKMNTLNLKTLSYSGIIFTFTNCSEH